MKGLISAILFTSVWIVFACGDAEESSASESAKAHNDKVEMYNAYISNDSNYVIYGVSSELIPDSSIYRIDSITDELHLEHDSTYIRLKTDQFGIVSGEIEIMGGDRTKVGEHLRRFASEAFYDNAFDTYILPWRGRPLFEILVFPTDQGLRLELLLRQHV